MFLIIGQGLAGALLAHALRQRGAPVTVLDAAGGSASRIASGAINPVLGARLHRAANLATFLPAALRIYRGLEEELGTPLVHELSALWLHGTAEEATHFVLRAAADPELLEADVSTADIEAAFRLRYGAGRVAPLYRIAVGAMLDALRERLVAAGALREEAFDFAQLKMDSDGGVIYDGMRASGLIFCEGASAVHNPFFSALPWAPAAGEALLLSVSGLPRGAVYKFGGHTLSPWPDGEDAWWFGASYRWDTLEPAPTAAFRGAAEAALASWLTLPYRITNHRAGVRPSTVDRKAFVGLHPVHPRIGLLNGLGSKGVLTAPFLAENFAAHLTEGTPLMPEADIARYRRVLLRAG